MLAFIVLAIWLSIALIFAKIDDIKEATREKKRISKQNEVPAHVCRLKWACDKRPAERDISRRAS